MKQLLHSLRISIFLILIACFGFAYAGSYEDFFSAIKQDNATKVKELLVRGFDANTPDSKGETGLSLALMEPSPKVASILSGWPKTNVNKLNAKGESPLMLAALKRNRDVAERLIKRGADVNKTGWAPLHYAASGADVYIVNLLLENSAYIDAESPNGTTPLMMAAMYGSTDVVNQLLQEGADPDLKNQQKMTALDFAQRGNRPDAINAIATAIRRKRPAGQW
jgi:ankyrin repeat protein